MPTIRATLFASIAVVAALGGSIAAGRYAVDRLETRLVAQARAALTPQDDWLEVSASGQQLTLTGAAPGDDARTAALARVTAAGLSAVLLDQTEVMPQDDTAPARQPLADLGVEIVFGSGATTIFGRIPDGADAADPFLELAETLKAAPMLSPQHGRVPAAWDESVALAVRAVGLLERGRIAIAPGRVEIRASAASDTAREQALAALQPGEGVALDAEISAPRRVIAPFAFEASLSDEYGWQVARCSAATVEGRERILAALGAGTECEVGLGAPSPDWPDVVLAALAAVEDLGAGRLEIADTDVALTGVAGQEQEDFSARTDDLAERLPAMFSLSATLPQPEATVEAESALAEAGFRVTRSPEGLVSMRGTLPDARVQVTAQNVAEAQFGMGTVTNETRLGDNLPAGWTAHVMTGLEALGMLDHGTLELAPGEMRLSGTVGTMRVRDEIARILGERLPAETRVVLDMEEAPRAAPAAQADPVVPAKLCAEQIALELGRNRIDFPPSESDIDKESLPVIDRIAEIMRQCPGARFEVAGHTDSQGRESSNMALSQARADAVLTALLERQVDTVFLYAKGYGETQPIANNETEEGRAANRRIEFSLLEDAASAPEGDAVDAQQAAPAAPEQPGAEAGSAAALGAGDAPPEKHDAAQRVATPEAGTGVPPAAGETAAAPADAAPPTDRDGSAAADTPAADGGADDGGESGSRPPVVSRAAQAPIDDLVTPEDDDGAEAAYSGPTRPRPRPANLIE